MKCPEWFRCVSCVIVYNSENKILLGKRKEGQAEAGKWGLLGGVGAFGESKSRWDFTRRELQYDVMIKFDPAALRLFKIIISGDLESLVLEDYLCYDAGDQQISATDNLKAPEEVRWFSAEEIKRLQGKGEIAFNNFEIIMEFLKQKTG